MATICRICGLDLRATGDPDGPYVHLDEGDPLKRNASALAHMDYLDKIEAAQRAEAKRQRA